MVILRNILSVINVWTALERKQHMIIEYFLFQKVFLFRGNSSLQFLAKTIVFQFSRMNLPLGKKNRMHPPIHPPPPSFFPQSEFQLPFLRFFRKNRQTNGQCYLPTQESTLFLNVCRKPTKTHDKSTMSVILETSLGEITVDLFTDERPRCQ